MKNESIRIVSASNLEWMSVGGSGLKQKVVRNDAETGEFLGLMAIPPLTRTGLHKHLDVAFAYHLSGSSTNYSAVVRPGELGITLRGTIHETIVYEQALTVVRTEGATMYPKTSGSDHIHSGAVHGDLRIEDRERNGCFSINPINLPLAPTSIAGVSRRMLFDYNSTGKSRRLTEFWILPGSAVPAHLTSDRIEIFVLAGDISIGGKEARASDFVLVSGESEIEWATSFGCRLLVWADGPTKWINPELSSELYGFDLPAR